MADLYGTAGQESAVSSYLSAASPAPSTGFSHSLGVSGHRVSSSGHSQLLLQKRNDSVRKQLEISFLLITRKRINVTRKICLTSDFISRIPTFFLTNLSQNFAKPNFEMFWKIKVCLQQKSCIVQKRISATCGEKNQNKKHCFLRILTLNSKFLLSFIEIFCSEF